MPSSPLPARWPSRRAMRGALALALGLDCGCGSRTGLLVEEIATREVDAVAPIFPILALVALPASAEGTYDYELLPFDPTSGTFGAFEPIPCLQALAARTVSMALDCSGRAYIAFADEGLWRVTTSSGDCSRTPFNAASQQLMPDLSLGFGTNAMHGETLYYVATDTSSPMPSSSFGSIDTSDFQANRIAPFVGATPAETHLGGSPDGRLFALVGNSLADVNQSTGALTLDDSLPASAGTTQAFAYWHGSYYLFRLTPTESTSVVRFTPGTPSLSLAGSTTWPVSAAAASLCQ